MSERGIERWVWTVLAVLQSLLCVAAVVEGAHPVPLALFIAVALALMTQAIRSWRS